MKYTLVTGASKGIGRAFVEQLVKNNKSKSRGVIGVARDKTSLEQIYTELNGTDNNELLFEYVQGSVTDKTTIQKIYEKCKDLELDSIIFNAGFLYFYLRIIDPISRLENLNVDQVKDSGVSIYGMKASSAYSCSKAALNMLAQCIAMEEPDIKCIAIRPGIVKTTMLEILENQSSILNTEFYQRVQSMKKDNSLLEPDIPATAIAKLILNGIPNDYNGKFASWDDEWITMMN